MSTEVNFDDIEMSPDAVEAYDQFGVEPAMKWMMAGLEAEDFPKEKCEAFEDGTLRIIIKHEGILDYHFDIPPGHWRWKPEKTN
jgi:hypothetical protein